MIILKMLCAASAQHLETGSIVDLDRVITEYAWRELKRDSRWYDCLRRVDFVVDVPWNFFEFDHKTTRFKTRSGTGEDGYRQKKQVELFRTDFTNSTCKDQVYKLRTQRQTKAATSVAIQKGFTLKGNTNFKLKIPEAIGHFGVSASADGYLRVCRARGETFEDTFNWQVDSDVTVEPKHVTKARLIVTEDELVADFEVRTSMRMPTGEAPIIVKRKGSKEIYAVLMISDLREVFAEIDCNVLTLSKTESESKKPRYAIEFVTQGILESVRWRNQKICLESSPIQEIPVLSTPSPQGDDTFSKIRNDDLPLYSSVIQSKISEQTAKVDERRTEAKIYDVPRVKKESKKDLRFNVVPTVIQDKTEDLYESPEKVISNILSEGIGISMPSLPLNIPHAPDVKPKVRDSRSPEAPKVPRDVRPPEPSVRELQRQFNISISEEPVSQPTTQDLSQYHPPGQRIYFRQGAATQYKPMLGEMTQISEETEKSTSKQSSMSEEGNIDDSLSLDSGDSTRKVSKVTSV